jgi:hypothetical protein
MPLIDMTITFPLIFLSPPIVFHIFHPISFLSFSCPFHPSISPPLPFSPTGVLAGIKVDLHQNIYVTVPRWKSGVPATLNKLKLDTTTNQYLLSPYPSWDVQSIGVAGQLQNCQSMVIDSNGLMFVIEVGRRNFYDLNPSNAVSGPPGVWIINTETSEVISQYYFPAAVASPNTSFVNDIVLDEKKQIAYLTDAGGTSGGLIIYNYGEGISRRYSGVSTSADPSYTMVINGVNYGTNQFTTPSDGIAITSDHKAIFYCAVQNTKLYRLATRVLNDFSQTDEMITGAVEEIKGAKEPSDGIIYWDGVLYFGSLPESTYYALKITSTSSPNIPNKAVPAWPDPVNMRWVSEHHLLLSSLALTLSVSSIPSLLIPVIHPSSGR